MKFRWQPVLRAALALFVVGFAIVVALAIRQRTPAPASSTRAPRTDPAAIAETTRGVSVLARGAAQDFKVEYERLWTYEDGTLRMEKVKVLVPQRQGRDFTITGDRARVTNSQSDVDIEGNVQLAASDGMNAKTDHANYENATGVLRVPGPFEFSKGRMTGRSVGASFDRDRDVLWLLKDARITVAADPATKSGALEVTSGTAGFARRDRYMRFENAVKMVRDTTTLEADNSVAYLAPDEDRLEMLELRGHSRVTTPPSGPGAFESMSARDMNLTYAPDGRTLQQGVLAGQSAMNVAGPAGQQGRRLSAEFIEFILGPDGATVTTLTARDRVQLDLPAADAQSPSRQIRSTSLEGSGEAGKGLTLVRFIDKVEFREQRPAAKNTTAIDRLAQSRTLDAVMQPGFGGIDRATFGGGVKFRDGTTDAEAPDATYDLSAGSLLLVAAPTGAAARVNDPQVTIDARKITMGLDTHALTASGDVRSLLKAETGNAKENSPGKGDSTAKGTTPAHSRPGMFRGDEPVHVIAKDLAYNSAAGTADYTGDARLWQGETAIQGATITLDNNRGNLHAKANVRSTWRLDDKDPKTGKVEQKTTIATADDLVYTDDDRRATYTENARMIGPQGDLRAAKIELYLAKEDNELERLEAYTNVILQSEQRTSTGAHLTYFAADARYVMSGAPVRILEQLPSECRETIGLTLTFFRSTDTILVDGNEERRTQTTSGGKCPGLPPSQ